MKKPVEKRIDYGPGHAVYLTYKDKDLDFIFDFERKLLKKGSLFHIIEHRQIVTDLRLSGWHLFHAIFFTDDYKELLAWHKKEYPQIVNDDILSPFKESDHINEQEK